MTQPIIKPTVGRVVWFHPSEFTGEAGFARHPDGQPYAAIIARVWSNILVNLTVFDANGAAHSRTSVPLVQDGGGAPLDDSYCEWMPYQKGQAAKTEVAEAQPAYRQRTQREELEYALVSGAAATLAQTPDQAGNIAISIQTVLDRLYPPAVSSLASITLPVHDAGSDSLEREIQAKASAGPRVTPEDIEAEIVSEHYFTAADGVVGEAHRRDLAGDVHPVGWYAPPQTELLTFCVLVLRNGFTATGESACASPENFNAEIGRKIARENAINKVWPLLGFRLRDKLAG